MRKWLTGLKRPFPNSMGASAPTQSLSVSYFYICLFNFFFFNDFIDHGTEHMLPQNDATSLVNKTNTSNQSLELLIKKKETISVGIRGHPPPSPLPPGKF